MLANEDNLELLSRLKFDGIEIPGCRQLNPDLVTRREVLELKDLLSSYDIEVAASNLIYPGGFQHASPDETVRSRSVKYSYGLIKLSSELGNKVLVWGGGSQRSIPQTVSRKDGMSYLTELLRKIVKVAEDYGVRIGLEILNHSESNVLNKVSEALRLIKNVSSEFLGITGDTYHLNIEEPSVLDGIRRIGAKMTHVHVSDHNREVPGLGDLNFAEIVRALKDIGYDQYLSIEARLGPDPETRLRRAKEFLVKYLP